MMSNDKRYLIFRYDAYYPAGGLNDIKESFDTVDDVKKYLDSVKMNYDFTTVYDRLKGCEIDISSEVNETTSVTYKCKSCGNFFPSSDFSGGVQDNNQWCKKCMDEI